MQKFLEKSSHDAVITVLILAQKGKMAFKTPFVPRELSRLNLDALPNRNSPFSREILIDYFFAIKFSNLKRAIAIPRKVFEFVFILSFYDQIIVIFLKIFKKDPKII